MHVEYLIVVGIGETKDGESLPTPVVEEFLAEAGYKLSTFFGGYTRTENTGGWIHPTNKRHVTEKGVTLSTITNKPNAGGIVGEVACTLKRQLEQHTVLIVSRQVAAREV